MTKLPAAIVLGVDTPIGLTIMRELGDRGVPVHAVGRSDRAIGRASRYCTSFFRRPSEAELADWLPQIIATTKAAALLAVSESDLVTLAALPPVIDGCQILSPRASPLNLVLDKRQTLDRAAKLGFDVPATWVPKADEDFERRAGGLTYPVVLKWADPTHITPLLERHLIPFAKAEFAASASELLGILARYRPLAAWPLVQSYCPGVGLGQMLFMAHGQGILKFQHRRLHEWPPEGGVSTLCCAEPLHRHAKQMQCSEDLLAAIGWEGPAMVEYRYDTSNDRYWLMEINGRFWGSLPLAWHCGAHFAWEAYRRAVSPQSEQAPLPRSNLQARYMIPETRRLLGMLRGGRGIADPFFKSQPWRDLARYVFGFLDPRMRYYIFSWRDPAPFFADLFAVLAKAFHLGVKRPRT